MRSRRGLWIAGIIALLCGLLINFPARVAVHWFVPDSIPVAGSQGTIWNGKAREASINGLYLRDVEWQMRPLRLFTGKLAYSVKATPASGFVESNVALGFGGTVSLTDLSAAMPLSLFENAVGIPGLRGNASANFERLEISDGLATAANGVLQLAGLVVPVVGTNSLGGYKAEFFTEGDAVAASIEDTDNVVDLAGSLLVRRDRSFQFVAQVIATAATPEAVRRQLRMLPPPNARGQQELRLEGIL